MDSTLITKLPIGGKVRLVVYNIHGSIECTLENYNAALGLIERYKAEGMNVASYTITSV